jgi:hypothetical protein
MRLATIVSIGLTVASPLHAQADSADLLLGRAVRLASRLQRENDSLRARVTVLDGAIRQYILAAAEYNQALQVAQGQVNWYANLPDRCVR